ncbi:hypothetical protein C8F01DRAFT_1057673, partial [Mycena amicta]
MHRGLQIPEIALEVVQYLRTERSALARLARTCRLFSDPALDVLWFSPGSDTLLYILRCLPADLVAISEGPPPNFHSVNGITVKLLHPVGRSDWERPQQYCRRVRSLDFVMPSSPRQTGVLAVLSLCLPTELLFPRLKDLEWHFGSRPDELKLNEALLLRLFLAPTLRSFSLWGSPTLTLSLLPIIASRTLPLTSIRLRRDTPHLPTDPERQAVSDFIRNTSLVGLETLDVLGIDADAFQCLAAAPNITSLVLESLHSMVFPASHSIPPGTSFSQLTVFRVSRADATLTAVLPMLAHSPLEDLYIEPIDSTTTAHISELFTQLAAHCACLPLVSFRCETRLFVPGDVPSWNVPRTAFLCLSGFQKLTTLSISTHGEFEFGDETIGTIAERCPSIEHLYLYQDSSESRFTLSVLVLLAKHCGSLEAIQITLDTSLVPSAYPTTDSGERISQSLLYSLSVRYSRIEDVFPIASFLSSLFPSLDEVQWAWEARDEGEEDQDQDPAAAQAHTFHLRWDEVERLVPKLATIRKEEQDWKKKQ